MMLSALIDDALRFAARAHDGHYRKADKTPYISHPVAVAMALQAVGADESVVAAALLHDTVEDTDVTQRDIEANFGPDVAALVAACTEPAKSLPWEVRKWRTIEKVRRAALSVKQLICADKVHTLSQMVASEQTHGADAWAVFSRGKARQAWFYRELAASLRENWGNSAETPLLRDLESLVAQAFDGVVADVPSAAELEADLRDR